MAVTLSQTIQLHRAQAEFHHSKALYRGYVGGRGAGKSWIGAYDLIRRSKPGRLYGVYAPTYGMLKDASLRSFLMLAQQFNFLRELNKSDLRAFLGNGAEVLFRSLDDPERARGPNLSGAWLDEASLMPKAAYDIIIAALREVGEAGWLSATFTPKGRSHWTYKVFGEQRENTALFHSRTQDNPFLPPGFFEAVRGQYTGDFAAQELGGEFIDIEGNLAKREWFSVVDAAPASGPKVRHWDFAATVKSAKADDPDYSVGTRLGLQGGVYYVEHVMRGRWGPGQVEQIVRQAAEMDGRACAISFEQEPGAAGKLFTAGLVKALAGWSARSVPATGDKVTRAMPFLAQAEAGNVRLVRAPWNEAWLEEVVAFPVGAHDDQVDSVAGAFGQLTRTGWVRGAAR